MLRMSFLKPATRTPPPFGRAAHKLRGAAANVGAAKLASLCAATQGALQRPGEDWLRDAGQALAAFIEESSDTEAGLLEIH